MHLRQIVLPLVLALLPGVSASAQEAAPPAPAQPIAAGQAKFLGSAWSAPQARDFVRYWNKVTPENAGKWGEVEAVRDRMDWTLLDEAQAFAKANGLPFHMHVMVWGNQQPEWIGNVCRRPRATRGDRGVVCRGCRALSGIDSSRS